MVKIKTKKNLTGKELIEYLLKQESAGVTFGNYEISYMEGVKKTSLHPEISGDFYFKMKGNGIFEIEIEEEITEETKLPSLLEIYQEFERENLMGGTSKNACIADRYDSHSVAFYMVHSDGTTTLLWNKEGGMQ